MSADALNIDRIIKVLSTYNGRDKAVRCIYFSIALLSTRLHDADLSKRWLAFGKQLSRARLVFRQPNLASLLRAAARLPRSLPAEEDRVEAGLAAAVTLIYAVQNAVELAAWCAEARLLRLQPPRWFRAALYLWILALFHGILRLAWRIRKAVAKRERGELTDKGFDEATRPDRIQLLGLASDFIAGVGNLPSGVLWGGRLSAQQSAAWSLVASVVGLYRCF